MPTPQSRFAGLDTPGRLAAHWVTEVKAKRPTEDSVLQWAVCRPDSHTGRRLAISFSRGHPPALLPGSRGTGDVAEATAKESTMSRLEPLPLGNRGLGRCLRQLLCLQVLRRLHSE